MLTRTSVKKNSVTFAISLLLACLGQSNARALSLPDVPLTSFGNVEHNVLMTFDDSGSMGRGHLPDGLSGGVRQHCSRTINGIAYDPAVLYTPPPVRNNPGNLSATPANLPDASFTAAWINGYVAGSATINLSTSYRPVWTVNVTSGATTANTAFASCNSAPLNTAQPAFYYVYNSFPHVGCLIPDINTEACYDRVIVSATSGTGPAGADERTNFANWYSYYRTRNFAAKAAAGRAFRSVGTNVRIAGHLLNNASATAGPAAGITFTNTTSTNTTNVLKRFCDDPANTDSLCIDGSNARTDFFTRLYNTPAGSITPLRAAMRRAGNSFGSTNTGTYSPYRDVPGAPVSASNPELSCRKNFHIMMTDGYWNDAAGVATDTDSVAHTLGDGSTAYTAMAPYSETPARAATLADNAFEFWYRDLRPDLTNNVRPTERDATGTATQRYWNPRNNPAIWQHMQNFTIGLGLTGTRNPANYFNLALPASDGDWDELLSGALSWPNPMDAEDGDRIDDLWHAAINSRGSYFSAGNPGALVAAFDSIIGQIGTATGSAAGLGASGSTTSGGGTSLFQVGYDANNWVGRLISLLVDTNGVPVSVNWEAGTAGLNTQNYTPGPGGRNIVTYNPTNAAGSRGVPFQWASLSAAQKIALQTNPSNVVESVANGTARLEYLRGASTNEGPGTPVNATSLGFRERTCYDPSTVTSPDITTTPCLANKGKLGDIVNSTPVYVGKPIFDYPDTLDGGPGSTYSDFVDDQAGRQATVYVGANDGMLHAFRADTGMETLAYVPNLVYTSTTNPNNLSLLTYEFYSHRFYVDGTPTVGDVFVGGAWRTMLVGGLRKGGKGYYALDITNPASFAETSASQIVKWEFPDPADPANPAPDMGYSFSQPTIFKMATGQWAAIFGNGYNSSTGRAMIFIVDIATGMTIQKIDTGSCANAPCGGGTMANPNGMATPAVVDLDDDYIADYIYAGDLFGNMWRIDVRSSTPANWSAAANVLRLFTAMDSAATPAVQPITTRPAVGFHPLGYGGLMVYFGTGKFLETNDNSATGIQQVQSFYGIYDRGVTGRSTEPSRPAPVVRADLLQQTISGTIGTVGTFSTRNISDNPINWRLDRVSTTTHLGWYVNLPTSGEKQVTNSLLREGRIIFTTNIPLSDACAPGGTGWLMSLNTDNGGRLKETFDLDDNGFFNDLDNNGLAYGAAGTAVAGSGTLSGPIVLTNPAGAAGGSPPPPCKETVESQASNGDIVPIKLVCKPSARESWRQIR